MLSVPWYVESAHFRTLVDGSPVRVVDGGSRGELFAPFDRLEANVSVIRFEPDAEGREDGTVGAALWNRSGKVDLHLASGRSASSVYPPNMELLEAFPDEVGKVGRRTEEVAAVEAISIDDAVAQGLCEPPDFIKLDIHSAEYEALEGAADALRGVVGVLVETWHSPVHRGQRLHGDVEQLLNRHGFHLYDHCPAAAWEHTLDGERSPGEKPRLVASESLFFRDFAGAGDVPFRTAMMAIALTDLYGYTNYAARLSREFGAAGVLSAETQAEVERELVRLRASRVRPPSSPEGWLRRRTSTMLGALRRRPAPPEQTADATQRLSKHPW